ncbi:hypothetical protein AKJ51_02395 [candidate division MSBL1 archaeon SCGC-AAA382A20]|uniref:AAA+ ATPase domain-containing protein n=1 Tax=candidate division MSBL1 archaeon SCGC-AAA382A20 TaxID=1698280 RepID=A0A133VKN5_9EURY|nr:hypothetical protein AKJ51_02395 [candidate division MSBL1 archaeon SCGC-AAA382A20]
MKIRDYLEKKDKKLKKGQKRIKNFKVFDFNYLPDRPLMRDEVKPLVDGLLRYKSSGIANHLLVFGSRGSGKTMMVRHLKRLLSAKLQFVYANCRRHNTSYKMLAHMTGNKPRGNSQEELWEEFTNRYSAPAVVILDEIDLLSGKDRHKDILYLLSRSSAGYMTVLLSNNPKFLSRLDESIKSTLQPEIIHFRHYTAHQIRKILEDRAEAGLKKTDKTVIGKIAALTTKKTNSDVRVAIKTLYYSALEPEVEVEKHFERARRDIYVDVLSDLNDKNLLILRAAAEGKSRRAKKLYSSYRRLSSRAGEEPFSYAYFYSNLSYLQSLGLILLVSTKIKRTYTNRIQTLVDLELIQAVCKRRALDV